METIEVLIADDSNLILKIITKALLENKIHHYRFEESKIHLARNGMEAFEMMGKNRNISMLISDINMPFLNGDDLVEVLIDTHLHQKILTIFITANESIIKHSTKKHTIGTIQKPFNYQSFSESLNELLWKHHEDKTSKRKQQAKQIAHIIDALKTLCKKHPIGEQIKEEHFRKLVDTYFNDTQVVEDEEIEFVFYSIIDELFKSSNIDIQLNQNDLKCALNSVSNTQHTFTLGLKEIISSSIESCQELLSEKKEIQYQLILNELITPLYDKVSIVRNRVIHYRPKRYALMNPYLEHVLDFFEKIDYSIRDEHLSELLAYKKDIEEFSLWMGNYCKENRLVEDIPKLKNSTKLLQEVYEKYTTATLNFNKMQNYIIGEIEQHLFYKALTSKEISSYLKKHLNDITPNISNLLLHLEKVDHHEHKKLAENDFHYLAVLSTDIDFLTHFKEEYEQACTNTKIFCFAKPAFFEDWIKSNKVDKILIDYDFSTSIFNSGIVYLKYFLKQNSKNKALKSLIKYNRYYIAASHDATVKEKDNLRTLDAHIIEKPLSKNSAKQVLVYS